MMSPTRDHVQPIGWLPATAAAAAAAALYALSPLTVLCAVGMFVIGWRATQSYSRRERRIIRGALFIALLGRAVCILAVFLLTNRSEQYHVLFGDGRFVVERSLWILNWANGLPISPDAWAHVFEHYGDLEYDRGLAIVQWLVGPAPYALALINVMAMEVGALLFYGLMRRAFGRPAAAGAFLVVLFWPTIFIWSFSMLKETVQLTLSTAALAASVQAVRRGGMSRVLYATIIILVLIVLTVMRPGSSAMVAAAIVFGLGMYAATRRAWIAAVAVTVSVAVGALVARSPAVQGWALHQMRLALQRHVGHVNTPGVSYRAADVRFYTSDAAAPLSMTPEEGVRFLLRSTALFFLVPLPSHLASTASWLFVPVNLTWYASLVLAAIGIPAGLKRDALVTLLAIGYVGAGIAVIAPNSGNVGTFVRHRDMVVPFVIGLSAVGALAIVSALMSRRPAWRERLP